MDAMTLIGALALAAVMVLTYRLLNRHRGGEREACHVTRCLSCDQKVRYYARNAGCTGLCPRCLKQLTLPRTPEPLWKPRRPHRVGERVGGVRR